MAQCSLYSLPDQFCHQQLKVSAVEYWYYLYIREKIPDIESFFNMPGGQKKFFRATPDFWSDSLKLGINLNGCFRHGHFMTVPDGEGGTCIKACPSLPAGTTLDTKGIHGETYRSIQFREKQLHAKILAETEMKEFRVVYTCQFEAAMKNPHSDIYAFFNRRQDLLGKKLPEPMKIRRCL